MERRRGVDRAGALPEPAEEEGGEEGEGPVRRGEEEQVGQGERGAVTERMSQADPQADVKLGLDCPACGHDWLVTFDILSFLWSEIETWAQRMLRDVHILARSYGWREADILAMSAFRRQCYLEMLGA